MWRSWWCMTLRVPRVGHMSNDHFTVRLLCCGMWIEGHDGLAMPCCGCIKFGGETSHHVLDHALGKMWPTLFHTMVDYVGPIGFPFCDLLLYPLIILLFLPCTVGSFMASDRTPLTQGPIISGRIDNVCMLHLGWPPIYHDTTSAWVWVEHGLAFQVT
jgi:hypothetical protein